MAQDAGHPALSFGRIGTSTPRQGNDISLQAYVQAWMHYLHIEYLHGVFHSDRYMLECFARNLNNCYAATLRPHLITLLRTVPNDTPVPQHWQPEHLAEYICFNAPSVGIYNLTPESTPRDSHSPTSRSGRPSSNAAPTRAIVEGPTVDMRQVEMMSEFDDDIVEMICQIAQMRRSCDLCQKEDHLILNCPRLRDLKSDPVKVRRMIRTIGSLLGISHEAFSTVLGTTNPRSSPRPGSTLPSASQNRDATPPRSNTMNTRQIMDGEETDDESVIRQLDSDVRSLNDTDEETDQDF